MTESIEPGAAQPIRRMDAATPWAAAASVILAGIVAALHVGKAPIALAQMQGEFARSLESLSWVMSVFPLIGVVGGMAAGVVVQRWGDRRMLSLGLLILAAASAAGAIAHSYAWLIASRVIEGLGFVLVVVAAPALLHRLTSPQRHNLVFGFWSIFMASGMALSMLLGPWLGGWRRLWFVDAGLALLMALLLVTIPAAPRQPASTASEVRQGIRSTLLARQPMILALAFGVYALQFFAVLSFLPIFLMQRLGLGLGPAGMISAAVVAVNIIGNVSAGSLLSRGVRPSLLMVLTSLTTGMAGVGLFLPATPAWLAVLLSFAVSAAGGLLPPTLLACAPRVVPRPALAPLSLGLVMQGNYLGQALGPLVIGTIVAATGWVGAAIPVAIAAALGIVLGLLFRFDPTSQEHV